MLKEQDYSNILQFQNSLLNLRSYEQDDDLIKHRVLKLLEKHFGYKKSFMGFLGNIEEKVFSPNISVNGVDMKFVQSFISELWAPDSPCTLDEDYWIFSQMPDYKTNKIYKKLFKTHRINDCLTIFLRAANGNGYIAYIVLFSENSLFDENSIKILQLISETISIAEDNYLKFWSLMNKMKLLQNATNYFPLGIMTIENLNNVTYTNDLAKEYLKELGYPDPRFYNMFYINELYKHRQFDLLNFGASKPLRIKGFLFNIITVTNPGKGLASIRNLLDSNQANEKNHSNYILEYDQITTCVYIISDKNYTTNMSISENTLKKIGLTNRECQVFNYLSKGLQNQEIAEKLFISSNTVKIHISNIFKKTNVTNRVELLEELYKLEKNERDN